MLLCVLVCFCACLCVMVRICAFLCVFASFCACMCVLKRVCVLLRLCAFLCWFVCFGGSLFCFCACMCKLYRVHRRPEGLTWGSCPRNLKMMTSHAVPVKNIRNFSLAPSALASNTLKFNRKNFRLRLRLAEN